MALTTLIRRGLSILMMLFVLDTAAAPRGALSPSAPVRLDYEMPESLPDSGSVTVPLQLSTPLRTGQLHVEVVGSEGLFVQSANAVSFELSDAKQPFDYALTVVLGAESTRYVIVLVSVDGELGSQSRSYRIDFSRQAPSVPTDNGLKLLPSTPLQ